MDIKSILVYIFFMVNFANAGILTDWYNNLNSNVNKVYEFGGSKLKKPESLLVLRPAEPTPKPVYKPAPPVVEKKENKSELYEICKLRFRSADIVMITVIKKGMKKAFEPIIIDHSTLEMSFRVEKTKKLKAFINALTAIKKSDVNKMPINLELNPKVISKLPKLNNEDIVILTIIKAASKGKSTKVVSHFVDKISAAPVQQSY